MIGVSRLVVVILILLISIISAVSVFIWSVNTVQNIFPENITESSIAPRGCLNILDANTTAVTVKNCGTTIIKKGAVYVSEEYNVYRKYAEFQQLINPQDIVVIPVIIPRPAFNVRIIIVADTATSPVYGPVDLPPP
jgi:hypothetical protein